MNPGDSCTVTAPLPYQALPVICTTVVMCVLILAAVVVTRMTQKYYKRSPS